MAIGAHNDHIGWSSRPVAHDSIYIVNHLFRTGGQEDRPPQLDAAQQSQVNALIAEVRRRTNGASARPDSIYNGADDDGSGSVSALEIAQYFASQKVKPKRSLLFVWHVGEEEGLYGSAWYTDHPTVPRESIVAQLNMDMIGRGSAADNTGVTKEGQRYHGNPDYVQLIGSRRLSTQLGDLAETANKAEKRPLRFDYSMDVNGHPLNIYCRSDHYEYARYGIPIIFFTTGGHADYHQVTDEPQYIDYDRMARVAQYVADLATKVANLEQRPLVDKPKSDRMGSAFNGDVGTALMALSERKGAKCRRFWPTFANVGKESRTITSSAMVRNQRPQALALKGGAAALSSPLARLPADEQTAHATAPKTHRRVTRETPQSRYLRPRSKRK
jgi:hypothetical protein